MDQIKQMLELIDRPAFCAENGRITAVNSIAANRQFTVGTEVRTLLTVGQEEYREFRQGDMWLKLSCCGESYGAGVTALGARHIFTLDPGDPDSELRMLALAAQTLREPLGNVMALVEELEGDGDTLARIERGLYQLLRIVGNMTPPAVFRPEMLDIGALLYELWDKVQPACESRDVKLCFTAPPKTVFSCADPELLTRAVHNLLSNALKYASPGDTIRLELRLTATHYKITMKDSNGALKPIAAPFTRYRREPGLGDGRDGLGLGLKIVHLAATAHGGAALLIPEGTGMRAELSLPLRQDSPLRSPRLRVSYTGERDPMLVELSDVLPPEFYKK